MFRKKRQMRSERCQFTSASGSKIALLRLRSLFQILKPVHEELKLPILFNPLQHTTLRTSINPTFRADDALMEREFIIGAWRGMAEAKILTRVAVRCGYFRKNISFFNLELRIMNHGVKPKPCKEISLRFRQWLR
jgi:hypothetical protein